MLNFNKLNASYSKPKNINTQQQKKINPSNQTNDPSIEGKDYVREQGFSTIIDKSAHELAIKPEIIIDNLLQDVNSIDIENEKDNFIYILLPNNIYLTINKKNGNIETEILTIPKPFRNILHFDIKGLENEKKIYRLHEIAYWMVYKSRTFYIKKGKCSAVTFEI